VWGDGSSATTTTNQNQYMVRAIGNGGATNSVVIYTAAGTGTGVVLAHSGTAWASISERRFKENIVELDPLDTLKRVENMPIYQFHYAGNDSGLLCRGPLAEDWHAQFPSKKNPGTIDTQDLTGVSLAAIRGLAKLAREQVQEIAQLKAQVRAMSDDFIRIRA
jgi:hypothetical protein